MTTATANVLLAVVQTATAWGTWTTRPEIVAHYAEEGAGQVLGSASMSRTYGDVRTLNPDYAAESVSVTQRGRLDLKGQWVRILVEDSGGTDLTIGAKSYTARWHGIVDQQTTAPGGASGGSSGTGEQQYSCAGIAVMLDRIYLRRGWEASLSNAGQFDPGYLPPFNRLPGGDRSYGTSSAELERPAYIHNRLTGLWPGANSTYWTALDILNLLLAGCTDSAYLPIPGAVSPVDVSAVKWTVYDPQNCLSYRPREINLDGMTVLQAINTLVSPRRGLTWRVSVTAGVASVFVYSTTPVALTVPSVVPYTLPATIATWAPDLSTGAQYQDVMLTEDVSSMADVIEVIGDRPWVTMTLELSADSGGVVATPFAKGWTGDEESLWSDYYRSNILTNTPIAESVWKRFTLSPLWSWGQYGTIPGSTATGIRNHMTTSSPGDSTYGWGGLTGERTHDETLFASLPTWPLEMTRNLPGGVGFNTIGTGTKQIPLCFRSIGAGGWQDLQGMSPYFNGGGARFSGDFLSITVDHDPPTIQIQTDDEFTSDAIRAYLTNSGKFLFTIGVREPAPLKVSWRRDPSTQLRDQANVMAYRMPQCEQWIVLNGTVKGVNYQTGGLITQADDQPVGDLYGLDMMRQALALMRAFYSVPACALSWRDAMHLDFDATSGPGYLVTTAKIDGGTDPTINGVITRRRWDFDFGSYGTSYTTERVIPDIEAIL